jgi:hypothetical protein
MFQINCLAAVAAVVAAFAASIACTGSYRRALTLMAERGEPQTGGGDKRSPLRGVTVVEPTLEDLGFTRSRALRYQIAGRLPDELPLQRCMPFDGAGVPLAMLPAAAEVGDLARGLDHGSVHIALFFPIRRPANHGRPLQKPTTHESQKN